MASISSGIAFSTTGAAVTGTAPPPAPPRPPAPAAAAGGGVFSAAPPEEQAPARTGAATISIRNAFGNRMKTRSLSFLLLESECLDGVERRRLARGVEPEKDADERGKPERDHDRIGRN